MDEDSLKKIPWSYVHYLNKEKIERSARLNYRNDKNLQKNTKTLLNILIKTSSKNTYYHLTMQTGK
ncbi:hypothetical protein F6Y02_43385 [Bacillus megaterium]|nr:hypothetical protein [Priestia megaterium]NGY80795.1 hypothetical protein [Priestia megaterium]